MADRLENQELLRCKGGADCESGGLFSPDRLLAVSGREELEASVRGCFGWEPSSGTEDTEVGKGGSCACCDRDLCRDAILVALSAIRRQGTVSGHTHTASPGVAVARPGGYRGGGAERTLRISVCHPAHVDPVYLLHGLRYALR